MKIFVLSSDKYLDALRPFAYLFNKYWLNTEGVVVAGFTKPSFSLPDNFYFHSIGKFEDYPVNKWSDALIDLLEHFSESSTCLIMLEDYWLTRQVDTRGVEILNSYMDQFRYVLKMDLTADRLYSGGMTDYGSVGYFDLVLSDPNSQYQMSMMCGIWNRKLLLKVLKRGETPWETEIKGTPRVRELKDECIVLGTRQWPVRHTLALRGGESSKYLFDELQIVDIKELIENGLLNQEAESQAEKYLKEKKE